MNAATKQVHVANTVLVNDPQMGQCAAIVVAARKDGVINAIGWTSMGANRTWTEVRHKSAPAPPGEAHWDLLTWEWPKGQV